MEDVVVVVAVVVGLRERGREKGEELGGADFLTGGGGDVSGLLVVGGAVAPSMRKRTIARGMEEMRHGVNFGFFAE